MFIAQFSTKLIFLFIVGIEQKKKSTEDSSGEVSSVSRVENVLISYTADNPGAKIHIKNLLKL